MGAGNQELGPTIVTHTEGTLQSLPLFFVNQRTPTRHRPVDG